MKEDEDSDEDRMEEEYEDSGEDQMEGDKDKDERELEQPWNQKFTRHASFSSTEVKGHTTITFTQPAKPVDVFKKFLT